MFETITVSNAIKRGNRMINYPILLIMFGTIAASSFLNNHFNLPWWAGMTSVIACIILPWIYWGFMITKWRIWAFENVRNVHELKKKAIESKLIWPDGSLWEKTEIRTAADKERLTLIEAKFDKPDIFADDYSVPDETIIYYSKGKTYFELGLMMLIVVGGICLFIAYDHIIGTVGVLFGGYMSYKGYRKASDTEPQIIINNKGISTVDTVFCEWTEVENEDVISERVGKAIRNYLVYDYGDGNGIKLEITDYDVSKNQLENLLHVYRLRSKKTVIH